jgi:Flp pilus assembly pilin Flp
MTKNLVNLVRSRRGAGMTEYIILVGIVAILAIAGFRVFGTSVKDKIQKQGDQVEKIQSEE